MYVFVYGSLKQGYWNHDLLENNNSHLLGEGIVLGHKLYHVSSFPGMIKSNNPFETVHGEVYEIDDKTLELLDKLEDEGKLYKRIITNAYVSSKIVKVSTYIFLPKIYPNTELVENNNWQGNPKSLKIK